MKMSRNNNNSNNNKNNDNCVMLLTLVLLFSCSKLATSFRIVGPESQSMQHFHVPGRMKTELMAWSIPTPNMPPLTSLTSAWYQECHPTARKTVYNDVFVDYTYMTESPFDNDNFWTNNNIMNQGMEDRQSPSSTTTIETASATTTTTPTTPNSLDVTPVNDGRRNPFRRAVGWARRRISFRPMK